MPANGSPRFQPEDARPAHHPQMRTTGPNVVDERLIGKMKKLNLDGAPRSIDNVRSPFEQDLISDMPPFDPHNPVPVYRGYTLFRSRKMFGDSPLWGEVTPRPMNLPQDELKMMIRKRKGSLAQKLNELGESKRVHLDNLTKLHNRNDDHRVEWILAYLDPVVGQKVQKVEGGKLCTIREITQIHIILVRKLKAGVSSNHFYSPSAPFGRNSSEDFIDLRPQAKEYRPPNPDVKPIKEMAGPGRDTGLPTRAREYRDDFDAPEGKPFKEKSGQGRDPGFVQLSPPRAGEYRPPHPGDDFDASEPKAFKEKSGQGRDPAFDRPREYHGFDAPEAKAFKERSGQGRDPAFDRPREYHGFDAPEANAFKEKSGQGRDPPFNQFPSPQAREYHPPEFDQFPPPRDGDYRPHDAPDVSGPGRHPGFDQFSGNYRPPHPVGDFDAPDVSGPGHHPGFDQFNGPRPPPTPAPVFGFGQGGIPHQLPNGGQHPMQHPMQPPPASKPAPKPVPAHVLGGEPPMPPPTAPMPPTVPMPPTAPMPPGPGPQPPGAHGGYPGAPGPTNGHMGAQHHNDFGPARKVGKAGEANRPFTSFGDEFPQDHNKLKHPPPEPKKYHTPSRPRRVVKVQTGPLPDDYDTDSSFDSYDSATSPEDDSSVSSFSPFEDVKTLKPRMSRGSLHNRQDHSQERIHRNHSRKPQKSHRNETRRERSYPHRRESRTYPSELVTIIPGGGVNTRREQPIRHRENQPIPHVLHTHTRRLDYPNEKFYPRDFQERRDEHTSAARDELRDELREVEQRRVELQQYLQERDKLEEMTRQQLRSIYQHNPRSYREPNMRHNRELYSRPYYT